MATQRVLHSNGNGGGASFINDQAKGSNSNSGIHIGHDNEDQGTAHHKYSSFSSLESESMNDMVAQNAKAKHGWVKLGIAVADAGAETDATSSNHFDSISVRRNIVVAGSDDNFDERMYLSLGIRLCGFDMDKGLLKVDVSLLQMEEDELDENGGHFPLLLESDEDESLTKHNHLNETISVRAEIVNMRMRIEDKEQERIGTSQTFDLQDDSSTLSWLHHGSTRFFINEKQLLLNAAKGSSINEARYSKLVKYYFWHEQTGAEMEIRSPSMPILKQTKAGDFTFYLIPLETSESIISSSLSPACTNGICDAHTKSNIGGVSSKDSPPTLKAKIKSSQIASFALDSDTSDDDGLQDEYVDDGFIVFGDVPDESESEPEDNDPDTKFNHNVCEAPKWDCNKKKKNNAVGNGGNANNTDNNDDKSSKEDSEEIMIQQQHSKRIRTNPRPQLLFQSESESDSEND